VLLVVCATILGTVLYVTKRNKRKRWS
jgi:hypothetical protein